MNPVFEWAESDPYQEKFLIPMIDGVASLAGEKSAEPIEMLLSFVQGIPCAPCKGRWTHWPTETLLLISGDRSAMSTALAGLLEAYQVRRLQKCGLAPIWALLGDNGSHITAGIRATRGRSYRGKWLSASAIQQRSIPLPRRQGLAGGLDRCRIRSRIRSVSSSPEPGRQAPRGRRCVGALISSLPSGGQVNGCDGCKHGKL